ncbi:hypothetical protein [Geobacter argillaceus]|uniref:Uncharacterized protein n=1 Tax=Geobacter argillaceus TaxID=345631 RepID=A0A562V5N5_9BACT|nr:hypothetical protein [Geobacter argillaceus]TWJ13185.1 hypothetical protein JN12_03962 [Geobacter argillaceus]
MPRVIPDDPGKNKPHPTESKPPKERIPRVSIHPWSTPTQQGVQAFLDNHRFDACWTYGESISCDAPSDVEITLDGYQATVPIKPMMDSANPTTVESVMLLCERLPQVERLDISLELKSDRPFTFPPPIPDGVSRNDFLRCVGMFAGLGATLGAATASMAAAAAAAGTAGVAVPVAPVIAGLGVIAGTELFGMAGILLCEAPKVDGTSDGGKPTAGSSISGASGSSGGDHVNLTHIEVDIKTSSGGGGCGRVGRVILYDLN